MGSRSEEPPEETPPELVDLVDQLIDLKAAVDSTEEKAQVEEAILMAVETSQPGVFGRIIRGYDRGDMAEALLGAVLFGIPMLVEGGTQEVGVFVARHLFYLVGTLAFAVAMVVGILYVADIQDVRVHEPLLGVVPRRLVGVLSISFLTALVMMTAWGRVDWAAGAWVAFCQCAVAFVPMAIGAALGDILPGS
ncbi:MAG: DUF2391 family protein [Haloarculaceae archaeon]